MEKKRKLLENAVLSIELGIEDYQTGDERRVLSAIRNLYAGVLLLCKHKLWNESPAGTNGSLIHNDLVPKKMNGSVQMVPIKPYRNTVDRKAIKERFRGLGIALDWAKLDELAEIRNDCEHMYMDASPETAKEALSSAMPLIEQLLVDHLGENPVQLFKYGVWEELLENKEVFEKQLKRCRNSFDKVEWKIGILGESVSSARCSLCGSSLIRQENPDNVKFDLMEIICGQCGKSLDREPIFESALTKFTENDVYIAMKDGEWPPLTTCPECYRNSWLADEGCVFCDCAELKCKFCDGIFHADDFNIDDQTCSYCVGKKEKIMRE